MYALPVKRMFHVCASRKRLHIIDARAIRGAGLSLHLQCEYEHRVSVKKNRTNE
jgi:hypothetical protein